MHDIIKFTAEKLEEGARLVLVTLVDKEKGAPGAKGQMMAVLEDGTTFGTIGGGAIEHEVILRSVKAIQNDEKTFEFEYDLNSMQMVCGGGVRGVGNVLGQGNQLIIFGGGHVAQSISKIAKTLDFQISVVDDREELSRYFTHINYLPREISELGDSLRFDHKTYIVIATRGHVSDFDALKYCVEREHAYIGMIGSAKKVASLLQKAKSSGIDENLLKKVYTPVGLDISDGTPAEIAISVLAEILLVKNKGNLQHKKMW